MKLGNLITGAFALVGAAGLIGMTIADAEHRSALRTEMQSVETLLLFHGYDVGGFAETPEPDLELVDAIAPPGCVDVWRVAQLAQLAIVRRAPAHKNESGTIGAAAAIAYAQDADRLECVGLAPQVGP